MPDLDVDWRARLRGDPLPWLLDEANPAVRHLALRDLQEASLTQLRALGEPASGQAARDTFMGLLGCLGRQYPSPGAGRGGERR